MAEIKSTLELVMQRTRNWDLSAAEREAQRQAQFLKRLSGVVQRYQDEALKLEEALAEIRRLQQESDITDTGLVLRDLADRLDIEGDNRALLDLLRDGCGMDVTPLTDLLRAYRDELAALRGAACEAARRRLIEEYRIRGNAVIALPEGAPDWEEKSSALKESYAGRLKARIDALACSD